MQLSLFDPPTLQDVLADSLRRQLKAQPMAPEYQHKIKTVRTPAGWELLRVSARGHTDASAGWPSPATQNADAGPNPRGNDGHRFTLQTAVGLTGWPTPDSSHHGMLSPEAALERVTQHQRGGEKRSANLDDVAALTGWGTPTSGDAKGRTYQYDQHDKSRPRPTNEGILCGITGPTSPSSPVSTERRGVLNAAFSRWLMGFPETWDAASPSYVAWCAVQDAIASGGSEATATPLFRPSPPCSSERT